MTPQDLDAIEARWLASTSGEWVYREGNNVSSTNPYEREGDLEGPTRLHIPDTICYEPDDMRFIAAAHQDVPALIAEIRRLWSVSCASGDAG